MTTALDPAAIICDPELQMRTQLCPITIARYAEALATGPLPPISVGLLDGQHILIDGWHRLRAHQIHAPTALIQAEVIMLPDRWALLRRAAAANAHHGLPLSSAEKRRAVTTWCQTETDPEHQPMGARELARMLGVSHTLVGEIRAEIRAKMAADASLTPPPPAPAALRGADRTRWAILHALRRAPDRRLSDDHLRDQTGATPRVLASAAKAGLIVQGADGIWAGGPQAGVWLAERTPDDDQPAAIADPDDAPVLTMRFGASTLAEVQALVADHLPALRAQAPAMSAEKAAVLLAIWATTRIPDQDFDDDGGPISRADIEAITGAPLDVHAGQLRRQGLITGDHDGYCIAEAGYLLVRAAIDEAKESGPAQPAQPAPTPNGADPELTHPRVPAAEPSDEDEDEDDDEEAAAQPPASYASALAALCERAATLARRWRARPPRLSGALLGRLVQIHGLNSLDKGAAPCDIAALSDAKSLDRLGQIMHDNICQDLDDMRRAPCMPRWAPIAPWSAYLDWLQSLLPTDQVLP
jgi:hypothetical protein